MSRGMRKNLKVTGVALAAVGAIVLAPAQSLADRLPYQPGAKFPRPVSSPAFDPAAPFTPTVVNYSLSSSPGTLHHTMLQKSDGTDYLLFWNEVSSWNRTTQRRARFTFPAAISSFRRAPPSCSA